MASLNQVVGQAFTCPLCGREHELRSNRSNNPYFYCSKYATPVNIQTQADVFLEEHVADALAQADGDGDPSPEDDGSTETDQTTESGSEPWRA